MNTFVIKDTRNRVLTFNGMFKDANTPRLNVIEFMDYQDAQEYKETRLQGIKAFVDEVERPKEWGVE